ncbi:MAG: hypothetical protein GQ559_06245, partial [Desulfobulbaceae bacterium]|nr:hypothetical protein [Desulfobulbaceae bacterium]
MKHRNTISRVEKTCKYILPMLVTFLFIALGPMTAPAGRYNSDEVSWRQTVDLYRKVPCLTEEQLEYGSQVLRGLSYNSQRIFRKMSMMEGIDFEKSRQAWAALLSLNLSFEQTLSFEGWADLGGIAIDFSIAALPEIQSLSYEAGKSFRGYLKLPGISAHFAIKTIPLLNGLEDANNRAAQGFFTIKDMDAARALDGMMILARLKDNQARACGEFSRVTGMNTETMLDALPLLAQLRQDDAWNARNLFIQESMTETDAWHWLVRYFATPPKVQETQFYGLEKNYKKQLLRAFYESGEELIWKINNLHAITDHFGFEISSGELRRHTAKQLRKRFEQLSPQVQFDFGKRFYASFFAGDKGRMITILRQATSADRVQTSRDLTSANIYALLSQGSELYDSSFRDILAPILKERIAENHKDDLLQFIQATDPENMLVSSFIVSLAQKGKLTGFFPGDNSKQEQILDLVASSAFKDEDSILLFSATFVHLLEVLTPDARTFLLTRMSQEADSGSSAFSRLIGVILQYYMQEYPKLLAAGDRALIVRLIIRHGAVDLHRYLSTP